MNLNFRKTLLMMGACSALGVTFPTQTFAESSYVASAAVQQSKKIHGYVSDAMGPVIGASIMVKGASTGTVTDLDGKFSLNVPNGAVITVSNIGYVTKTITVGNKNSFNITLQ